MPKYPFVHLFLHLIIKKKFFFSTYYLQDTQPTKKNKISNHGALSTESGRVMPIKIQCDKCDK